MALRFSFGGCMLQMIFELSNFENHIIADKVIGFETLSAAMLFLSCLSYIRIMKFETLYIQIYIEAVAMLHLTVDLHSDNEI
jgi:hypothetical protein